MLYYGLDNRYSSSATSIPAPIVALVAALETWPIVRKTDTSFAQEKKPVVTPYFLSFWFGSLFPTGIRGPSTSAAWGDSQTHSVQGLTNIRDF